MSNTEILFWIMTIQAGLLLVQTVHIALLRARLAASKALNERLQELAEDDTVRIRLFTPLPRLPRCTCGCDNDRL